jgi:uncharacterized protein involved in exopolysaccharide biosynthesis
VRVAAEAQDSAAPNGAAILAIFRRRMLVLLMSAVLVPLVTYIAIGRITPLYTASGTLLYDPSEYKLRELQSILRVDPITDAVMTTQAEVLRGMPVIEQVATRLNLHDNPEFNASLQPPPWWRRALRWFGSTPLAQHDIRGPQLDPVRNATLATVRAALAVTPVKSSHVLDVSFTAQDPVLAAAAVNDAMDIYVKSQLGAKFGAVAKARDWLERRSAELRAEVRRQEDAIAQYRAQKGLIEGMHGRLEGEQISLLRREPGTGTRCAGRGGGAT